MQQPAAQPTLSPDTGEAPPQSDWKFYSIISIIAVLVIAVGGYFMYQKYLISLAPTPTGDLEQPENPVISEESINEVHPTLDYKTDGNIIPPEGEQPILTAPTTLAVETDKYNNQRYQFSFTYEQNPLYQIINCTPPTASNPNTEEKDVFFDPSEVSNNEEFFAICSPEYTQHEVKIAVSQNSIECLGSQSLRTVAGVEAFQCEGKTSSLSSLDSSTSLLIPKEGGTILIEVNSPEYLPLLNEVTKTFSFSADEPLPGEES